MLGLMSKSIRIKTTKLPGRPDPRKRFKPKGGKKFESSRFKSTEKREHKYQMIKLIRSGRTLAEAKALVRAGAVGLEREYASEKDLRDLASLEGGLHGLLRTRFDSRKLMEVKFAPRKDILQTRNERLATWLVNYGEGKPINWTRDGNLIRRGPPNRTRPGSSKGKIGKTIVRGAGSTLKDFRILIKTLQQLQTRHGKANMSGLKKAYKSLRKDISAS